MTIENLQLIHDFIDGTLDKAQEDKLFMLLNAHEDLRGELKEFVALETTMKSDAAALTPPAASTVSIFSHLGYTSANGSAPISEGAAQVAKTGAFGSFFTRYGQGFKSGLFCTVATAIVCLYLINPYLHRMTGQPSLPTIVSTDIESGASQNRAASDKIRGHAAAQSDAGEMSQPDSEGLSRGTAQLSRNIRTPLTQPLKEANNQAMGEVPKDRKPTFIIARANGRPSLAYADDEMSHNETPFGEGEQLSAIPGDPWRGFEGPSGLDLVIEVRAHEDWSIPAATVPESGSPLFRNTSMTLFKPFADDWRLGIDLRQEFFYQEFEGVNADGQTVRFIQRPSIVSFSLAGRYTIDAWGGFSPFVQATLGGTEVGFIGRGMLGLEFTPNRDYTMILSLESSSLLFQHNNSSFWSSKVGLHYGISFHL